jgi:hypothetical protein
LTAGRQLGETAFATRAAIMLGSFYLAMGLWLGAQRAGWMLARRLFKGTPPAAQADGRR